jgi:hypothetical protein
MSQAKSAPFVAGILFGVIVALLAVIALRDGTPVAMAQATGSGPGIAGNMTIVTGMTQQNLTDMAFVLSVGPTGNKHLAVYHVRNGQTLRLLATRDITYDLMVPELKNEAPAVSLIKKEVEAANKKTAADLGTKIEKDKGGEPK